MTAQRMAERCVLEVDRPRFAREALDATVAYLGVANAPLVGSRTRREKDGSIWLSTALRGRVVAAAADELVLEQHGVRSTVRHMLPAAIGLSGLVGQTISVDLVETLRDGRCTIDARIRDAHGALILWARDGDLPEDRISHGLALRMRMSDGGRGLVIAHRAGLANVRGPGIAIVESDDEGSMLVLVLRTGDDEVSYVALRR
jgi:hypothetical protein